MPGTISRSTLRQQIADALREEVLSGRLGAGTGFTVREIAEQYGVSATPVREALFDLTAQGLLEADQHRGFRVHEFTTEDFGHMVQARAILVEGIFATGALGGGLSLENCCTESVRRRADASRRAAEAGDLDVLIGYDLRFWRELGELVANPYIAECLDRLRVHSWVYSVPTLRAQPDLRGLLWSGHLEVFEAVRTGDSARARSLIREYNEHSLALVRDLGVAR